MHVNRCLDSAEGGPAPTLPSEDAGATTGGGGTSHESDLPADVAANPLAVTPPCVADARPAKDVAETRGKFAELQAWAAVRSADNAWRARLMDTATSDAQSAAAKIAEGSAVEAGSVEAGSAAAVAHPIRILSWNIADDGENAFGRSAVAPPDWTHADNMEGIKRAILHQRPHLVALQECRGESPEEALAEHYCHTAAVRSHSGFVHLLVRRDIGPDTAASTAQHNTGARTNGLFVTGIKPIPEASAVAICLDIPASGHRLALVSVHLAPGSGGKLARLTQMKFAVHAAQTSFRTQHVCVIGDTNLRKGEIEAACEVTGTVEIALDCGFTWDSRINLYNGTDAFGFCCNFDRVFLKNGAVDGEEVGPGQQPCFSPDPQSFRLVGDVPPTEVEGHYLSDHFGICLELVPC